MKSKEFIITKINLEDKETIKVPINQKPRQGPLRPQTGGGAHRDKKKEQKQGKEKHKGKTIESFHIDEQSMDQIIDRLHEDAYGIAPDHNFYVEWLSLSYQEKTDLCNSMIQSLNEASNQRDKRNPTRDFLRRYPVSDKDVAKPVKKPEKKKPQQGVAEAVPFSYGFVKRPRKGSVADLAAKKRKEQEKGKPPIEPKDQMVGVAKVTKAVSEGSLETDNMVSHIGQVIQSIYPRGGDKNTYMKLVAQEMPRIVKANPKLFRRAFGMAYDRFFHIDQDDDNDYTDYSMRQGELGNLKRGMAEDIISRMADRIEDGYGNQAVSEDDDNWSVEYKGKDYECNDQDHAVNKARKFLGYDREKNACIIKRNGKPIYSWRQGEKIQSIPEGYRSARDWDEGNKEPPNNFAVYINGKKWKVFQGRGRYAEDEAEFRHYQQLKSWAAKKSAETGKKWEVVITGEKATESVKEDTDIPFNQCPHCRGNIVHESLIMEKQDACYHKVKSRYKVWPSAYASGALVQCRKKGAGNWGKKK